MKNIPQALMVIFLSGILLTSFYVLYHSERENGDIKGVYISLDLEITGSPSFFINFNDTEVAKAWSNHSIIIVSFTQKGITNVSVVNYTITLEYSNHKEKQFNASLVKAILSEEYLRIAGLFKDIPELPLKELNITGEWP